MELDKLILWSSNTANPANPQAGLQSPRPPTKLVRKVNLRGMEKEEGRRSKQKLSWLMTPFARLLGSNARLFNQSRDEWSIDSEGVWWACISPDQPSWWQWFFARATFGRCLWRVLGDACGVVQIRYTQECTGVNSRVDFQLPENKRECW